MPNDVHRVLALIVGVFRLSVDVYRARAGDVDLFGVVSGQDENMLGRCVVW